MDKYNTFFTRTSYQLVRLDWLCIMAAMMTAVAVNWRAVDWWTFWIMFWWIDLVGTVPGMYHHARRKNAPAGQDVPRWCIVAYNGCHSFATVSLITLIWYFVSGLEWAMLAMPIHLAADRCVFGNIYKNFGLKFEPAPNRAFQQFYAEFSKERAVVPKAAPINE